MLNYFLNALLISWLITYAFTQSEVFCSKKEDYWQISILHCLLSNGKPMSFHGITGLSIEDINLRSDVAVWTSDFLYSDNHQREPCLCSFRYLTIEIVYERSDVLFSYCDDFKYFICRNNANNVIEVFNNTWDNASRCQSFNRSSEINSILKPGYYWIGKTNECGFYKLATNWAETFWQTQATLCGAYSKSAGRHFRQCNTLHIQICVSSGASLSPDLFDRSCFLDKNTETTEIPKVQTVSRSYSPEWTKLSENVTASTFEIDTTPSVSHTKPSNFSTTDNVTPSGGYTTKLSQTSTRTTQNTSETQTLNETQEHARGSSHEHGDPDTGTDAGTIARIVGGVCFALAVVAALFIYIQRSKRCLSVKNTSNSTPKTNEGTSNLPNKSKARTLFNNFAYDSWDHKQSQAKKSKRNNIKISNNGMSGTNQLRTGKDKELPSSGNIIYYNQSTPTYANDLNEAQTTATSTYSFAEETEINVGEDMSQDDYDTTLSTRKGVHKTENLYNKIGPENNSNDVYDSTLRQEQSFETDDVYNKLTCKTNYGKFGTTLSDYEDYDTVGDTLKNQNTVHCTDSVYNKL